MKKIQTTKSTKDTKKDGWRKINHKKNK